MLTDRERMIAERYAQGDVISILVNPENHEQSINCSNTPMVVSSLGLACAITCIWFGTVVFV